MRAPGAPAVSGSPREKVPTRIPVASTFPASAFWTSDRPRGITHVDRRLQGEQLEGIVMGAMAGWWIGRQPALHQIAVAADRARCAVLRQDAFLKAAGIHRQSPDDRMDQGMRRRRFGIVDHERKRGRSGRNRAPDERRRDAFTIDAKAFGQLRTAREGRARQVEPHAVRDDLGHLSPRTLETYRAIGGSPIFRGFGRHLVYAGIDLEALADLRGCDSASDPAFHNSWRARNQIIAVGGIS